MNYYSIGAAVPQPRLNSDRVAKSLAIAAPFLLAALALDIMRRRR